MSSDPSIQEFIKDISHALNKRFLQVPDSK